MGTAAPRSQAPADFPMASAKNRPRAPPTPWSVMAKGSPHVFWEKARSCPAEALGPQPAEQLRVSRSVAGLEDFGGASTSGSEVLFPLTQWGFLEVKGCALWGGSEAPITGSEQITFGRALDGGQDSLSIRRHRLDVFMSSRKPWYEFHSPSSPARWPSASRITSLGLCFPICKVGSTGLTSQSGGNAQGGAWHTDGVSQAWPLFFLL